MLNPLILSFREGVLYRAKGNILWLAHRLSGLGIVLFLGFHIFGMSMSAFNPPLHEQMLELYKSPLFSVAELGLAACLIFHAVNGTRIAILELRPQLWEKQEVATRWSLIIVVILLLPTLAIMAYKSITHFIGG